MSESIDMTSAKKADQISFYKLIKNKKIRIPNYQREYAQGRENRRAEMVRTGLVEAFHSALDSDKALDLDFIFGGGSEDFVPIDGQQRLTSLFLLHWYIFWRANKTDRLGELKNFEYATRTTSTRFCQALCEEFSLPDGDLRKKTLSGEIRNASWFTGAMVTDPTVKSMLNVLDCIHVVFDGCDCADFFDKLTDEACPITFFALDTEGTLGVKTGVEDLYMKMNARGVPLTDFEIFKAELQKQKTSGYDLLQKHFETTHEDDNPANRSELIGKFNNEYTNFFFKVIDDAKVVDPSGETEQSFDRAMMNFIREIFLADFFCAADQAGISDHHYRSAYEPMKQMSGKEFSDFIENFQYRKYFKGVDPSKLDKIDSKFLKETFSNTINLLDVFSSNPTSIFPEYDDKKIGYNCEELFKKLGDKKNCFSLSDMTARCALYDFTLKYREKLTEDYTNAFAVWQRFVWKIMKNTDIKTAGESTKTLLGFRTILKECDKEPSPESIWKAIDKVNADDLGAPAYKQFQEERLKANLIKEDDSWKQPITDAENHFKDSGQIYFLLEVSKIEDSYNLDRFKKAFDRIKEIFGDEKKLLASCKDKCLFERALLACSNGEYMPPMNSTASSTKKFVDGDFSDILDSKNAFADESSPEHKRYDAVVKFLGKIVDDSSTDLDKFCKKEIGDYETRLTWQSILVKHHLDRYGFEPEKWTVDGHSYTAVYTTGTRRTECGELYSFALYFALYSELIGRGIDVKYCDSSKEEYLDGHGFPHCHLEKDGDAIAHIKGEFYKRGKDRQPEKPSLGNFDEAYKKLIKP